EDLLHAVHENLPLGGAPEIVCHEETAAQQVFAQSLRLGVRQLPVAGLYGVKPGPVSDTAFVEIHGLFYGADVEPREAAQGQHEMAIGARVILGPHGVAFAPQAAAAKAEAASAAREWGLRIHQ